MDGEAMQLVLEILGVDSKEEVKVHISSSERG